MSSILITLVLSGVFCGLYLLVARRLRILDTPNDRSSHESPTPHGGGVGLMLALVAGVCLATPDTGGWPPQYLLLLAAAIALMLLGVVDDLKSLPVRLRFTLYAFICLVTASLLLAPQAIAGPTTLALVGVAALAMLWSLNLYNFMDGIDGIAAIQCLSACSAAALMSWNNEASNAYVLFCLLLAASHGGFLLWNFPPARLFMGDAGSVPTGFLVAGLALLGAVNGELPISCWLILLALFITDASYTLVWRLLTGQAFTQAHRLHAYQRLSRHWGSHLAVDILLLVLITGWLIPLAWGAQILPKYGFLLVILAYLPLVWAMAKVRDFG